MPELCEDAALLCDAMDVSALAVNLLKITTSTELAGHYRSVGIAQAKKFSWVKAAQQTLEIFDKVV